MTMIKNYWAFTSKAYKLVMWLVIPIVALGTTMWGYFSREEMVITVPAIVCFLLFPIIDIISDFWLLPGFYAKGNSSLEFLQSTTKFQTMIRDVVIVDIVRRVVLYVGTYVMMYALFSSKDVSAQAFIQIYFYQPVLNILVSQTAVFIARFFRSIQQVFGCSMLSTVPNAIYITIVKPLPMEIEQPIVIVLAGVAIVMIAVTIWFTRKKVRDSFYDK